MTKLVTPCVGVWIETELSDAEKQAVIVTPCVGVWIETWIDKTKHRQKSVTPCVGVWIETSYITESYTDC